MAQRRTRRNLGHPFPIMRRKINFCFPTNFSKGIFALTKNNNYNKKKMAPISKVKKSKLVSKAAAKKTAEIEVASPVPAPAEIEGKKTKKAVVTATATKKAVAPAATKEDGGEKITKKETTSSKKKVTGKISANEGDSASNKIDAALVGPHI